MFTLPKLVSLEAPLPHEQPRRRVSSSAGGARPSSSSAPSAADALASMRRTGNPTARGGGKGTAEQQQIMKLAKKRMTAGEIMYLVPSSADEAARYKSVLVFCDMRLREASTRRRRHTAENGPDLSTTAACCHVLDQLAGPLWPPFQKVMGKLQSELLVSLYSDFVEPSDEPPYLQRLPYHRLAERLQQQNDELDAELSKLKGDYEVLTGERSDLQDMVLEARTAVADTERQLIGAQTRCDRLEREVERTEEEGNTLRALADKEAQNSEGLRHSLAEMEGVEARESVLETQVSEMADNISELHQELKTCTKALEDREAATAGAIEDGAAAVARAATLQARVEELEAKLADATVQLAFAAPAEGTAAAAEEGRIECRGTGDVVLPFLRFEGSVARREGTVAGAHALLCDALRLRARERVRDAATAQHSFAEYLQRFFGQRWTAPVDAAEEAYNFYADLESFGTDGDDPLCRTVYKVVTGAWSELYIDELVRVLRDLQGALALLPSKGGLVQRTAVAAALPDCFPLIAEKALVELRKSLGTDSPGVTLVLGELFEGGLGGGGAFVELVCAVYVADCSSMEASLRDGLVGSVASAGKCTRAEAGAAIEEAGGVGTFAETAAAVDGGFGADGADAKDVPIHAFVQNLRTTATLRSRDFFNQAVDLSVGGAPAAGSRPDLA